MATSKTNKKRAPASKKKATPLVSEQRKKEILGLILMVVSVLLALALVTYDAADNALARSISFEDLKPGRHQAGNALGLVGAWLALRLVQNFLGYPALLLMGLLFAWGYIIFRRRKTIYLPLLSILGLIGTFILSSLLG